MKKKKNILTKKERKVFAPLQAHEDKERAKWFLLGAAAVMIANIAFELFV